MQTNLREITMSEAINEAIREEMQRDENVVLWGEDVGVPGGVFKVTRGILDEFGTGPGIRHADLRSCDRWCCRGRCHDRTSSDCGGHVR